MALIPQNNQEESRYKGMIEGDVIVYGNASLSYTIGRVLAAGAVPSVVLSPVNGFSKVIDPLDFDNYPEDPITGDTIADLHYIKPTDKLIELLAIRESLDAEGLQNLNYRMSDPDALIGMKALAVEMLKYPLDSSISYDGDLRDNDMTDPIYFTYSGDISTGTLTVVSDQEIFGFYIIPRGYAYNLVVIDKFSFSLSGPEVRAFLIGENSLGVFLFLENNAI